MKTLIAWVVLLLAPSAFASTGGVRIDALNLERYDVASLQRGAQGFVNYCMGCHSASYMRFNRLTAIGLTEEQIKDNLIFTDVKVGDTMRIAMSLTDGKSWFGAAPPDLSVIARSRGTDWLYTYLRTFYRDPSRPTGWNNLAFASVGMPHVLYELQGVQTLKVEKSKDAHGHEVESRTLVLDKPGRLTPLEYDRFAADLTNFLAYAAEPARYDRVRIGVYTLLFLGVLLVFAWLLKREFWKDVH